MLGPRLLAEMTANCLIFRDSLSIAFYHSPTASPLSSGCVGARGGGLAPPARNAVSLAGDAPTSAVFNGSVLPRSPFRRPTSGSSWLDWRPVIGTAPGGSAGQLDYRQTTSAPTGQHGAGDARAPLSPSPTSRSLRLAYGSWIAPELGLGLEPAQRLEPALPRRCTGSGRHRRRDSGRAFPYRSRRLDFAPTRAPQSRARQRPRRRSRDASWSSPPRRFRPQHGTPSILRVKRDRRNRTSYVHRHRCCPTAP